MHTSFRTGTFSAFLFIVALTGFESSDVHAQDQNQVSAEDLVNDPIFRPMVKKTELNLYLNYGKVIELPNKIRTVSGYDDTIVDISIIEGAPDKIRVFALAEGITNIAIFDEHGDIYTIETIVQGDVTALQRMIKHHFPHVSIEAVAIKDVVILKGWVMQPEQITQIIDYAEQYFPSVINHMTVGGVQQVKLKVRVMEVQRSVIRRLGFNFLFADQDMGIVSQIGSITPASTFNVPINGQVAATVLGLADPTILLGLSGNNSAFEGFLEALKRESLLKILAEPELVTTNGHPAYLLSGGEFPILVPQSLGTTTIEWREFGVSLKAVPIILGRGRVRLQLEPEVSERDFTSSVNLNGILIPGITTRRVNTQVEMRFGETYMIAGLISTRATSQTEKIPIVGELPWIGAAFRRLRYEEAETELVIMVTPELVGPLRPSEVLPRGPGLHTDAPTDRELYGLGLMEVPYFGDRCEGCSLITPTSFSGSSSGQKASPTPITPPSPSKEINSIPSLPEISFPIPAPNSNFRKSNNPFSIPSEQSIPKRTNSVNLNRQSSASRAGSIKISSDDFSDSTTKQVNWSATKSRSSNPRNQSSFGKSPFGQTESIEHSPKTRKSQQAAWINQSRWRKTGTRVNKREKTGLIKPGQNR